VVLKDFSRSELILVISVQSVIFASFDHSKEGGILPVAYNFFGT